MCGRVLKLFLAAAVCGGCFCGKASKEEKPLVKIAGHVLNQDDFDAFNAAVRSYPHAFPKGFPGDRERITFMTETQLLYSKAPSKTRTFVDKEDPDWQLKKIYFPATAYALDILTQNLGAAQDEIDAYYKLHKESYKVTVKVPIAQPTPDTAKKDTAAQAKADSSVKAAPKEKDSTYYRDLLEVKDLIVKDLFLAKYPPDSLFIKNTFGDSVPDSNTVKDRWFYQVSRVARTRNQDFFLFKFCSEFYGEAPKPDSMEDWALKKGIITEADLNKILQWLPERDRSLYKDKARAAELYRWLFRWKVYAQKAEKTGYSAKKETAKVVDWAYKLQVVKHYLESTLIPQAEKMASIDTAMCTYAFWDSRSSVVIPPDTAGLNEEIKKQGDRQVGVMLDSLIYGMRKKSGVQFLQSDYRDDKGENPAVLVHTADSLRDTGNTEEAEKYYRKLTVNFPFSTVGARSFTELAKVQTERQMYNEAIENYRRFLVCATADDSQRCNAFFMVGFIYDEYLNKPELAEVNYRWVLKNTPNCELADDAEFMVLHLDEPMVSIEELRFEAMAQGRNVNYDEDTTAVADTAASKAEPAKKI